MGRKRVLKEEKRLVRRKGTRKKHSAFKKGREHHVTCIRRARGDSPRIAEDCPRPDNQVSLLFCEGRHLLSADCQKILFFLTSIVNLHVYRVALPLAFGMIPSLNST